MRVMGIESVGILLLITPLIAAEPRDSLQSALTAVNQREKVLFSYPNYGNSENSLLQFQSDVDLEPTKLVALTSDDYNEDKKSKGEFEQNLMDYFSEGPLNSYKSNYESSPFRERNKFNLGEIIPQKLYLTFDKGDNVDFLKLYKNYYKQYLRNMHGYESMKKRPYSNLSWDSVGMTKRADYPLFGNGYNTLYSPKMQDMFEMNQEGKDNLHYPPKRFPINKRSSDLQVYNLRLSNKHKRTSIKDNKTDPKIEKELTNIFNSKRKETSSPLTPTPTQALEKVNIQASNYMPIDIKKKSIDWSDYFGLDRRKKTSNGLDNEWLLERYHKTISLQNKRNVDGHEQTHKELKRGINRKEQENDDMLKKINEKIQSMEEAIIDETLKFTGAHEDSIDTRDVQQIKDHIIARLAAAYSLEKMRRAIDEYKESLEKDSKHAEETKIFEEEKRVSVPRKEATLSHHNNNDRIIMGDNDIKCAHANKDCYEQNYKSPSDLLETYNLGDCQNIEIACNELIIVYGEIGRIFQPACKMYQFCSLCDENEWFIPSRRCSGLFLSKADFSCGEDFKCHQISGQILKYVQRINKSLRMESNEECPVNCPAK